MILSDSSCTAYLSKQSSNQTSLPFLLPGSILSGILHEGENITLDAAGSPYESDGSLAIDGFLEIMPNVTIQMKAGSGIVVRKGNMKAIGTADAPILFTSLTDTWSGLVMNELYSVAPSFKLMLAYDESASYSYSVGKDEFNRLFNESESKVLYRYCPQCTSSHKHIFYKRSANPPSAFDVYDAMTCDWTSINNTFNIDFGVLKYCSFVCNFWKLVLTNTQPPLLSLFWILSYRTIRVIGRLDSWIQQ